MGNTSFKSKFIGDKSFYKKLMVLVIPLIVQQGVTNFVNLLDNVMVGSLGTTSISAVAIVNQLIFVFNLAIFGGLSGAAIFGAQFFGKGDSKGFRETFRFKMIFGVVTCVLAIGILAIFPEQLINLYLHGEDGTSAQLAETLSLAKQYLKIMLWGLAPFMVVQTYAGTLREMNDTVAAMKASVVAIFINLIINYILIFGMFGFPALGVVGAAIGTVISRYVEMLILVIHTHRNTYKYDFARGAYKSLHVSGSLVKKVAITGSPLLFNEIFWSLGTTFVNQNYSVRGLSAVAAISITSTAWQVFCVIMFAMGNAVAIIVGQHLGAGEIEEAKSVDNKLIFVTVAMHIVIGGLFVLCAPLIPLMYDIEPEVRTLTTSLLMIAGASLPIHAYAHVVYFTIRSGGKTMITFLFDCVYTWVVPAMLSLYLCRFTDVSIVWIYCTVQFIDIIKVIIGTFMLKSGFWAKNVVNDKKE